MQIELRRIKVFQALSRETTAFTAELWCDGRKLGRALNDGGGGATRLEVPDRQRRGALEAYAAGLPRAKSEDFPEGLAMNLDFYLALLVERHLEEKYERALCRKHILLQLKDAPPGEYIRHPMAYSPPAVATLRQQYGGNLACVVNERYAPRAPVRPLYAPPPSDNSAPKNGVEDDHDPRAGGFSRHGPRGSPR